MVTHTEFLLELAAELDRREVSLETELRQSVAWYGMLSRRGGPRNTVRPMRSPKDIQADLTLLNGIPAMTALQERALIRAGEAPNHRLYADGYSADPKLCAHFQTLHSFVNRRWAVEENDPHDRYRKLQSVVLTDSGLQIVTAFEDRKARRSLRRRAVKNVRVPDPGLWVGEPCD
ncbi:MAG: hypothetical protein WC054_00215 [Candidatus Nanopelagicales bacterium]